MPTFNITYSENVQTQTPTIEDALTAAQSALDAGVTSEVAITVGPYVLLVIKN
jgi:hypothetical protein